MFDSETVKIIREHYHARAHNHQHYHNDSLGFGFIHYALIRNIRPERVLVVGSQRGFVPAICALACKDEGRGHVDFVDAGYDLDHPDSWGGVGVWKTAGPEYWEPLGVRDWITLHCITTEKFSAGLDAGARYQYIYIDGDHSFEGVSRDFSHFVHRVSVDGFIIFHDVCEDKETRYGRCGVKDFWNIASLCPTWEKLTLPFDAGLGIWRRTT